MRSPAYKFAVDFTTSILKAIKNSEYPIDYPLEQLIATSSRIGYTLLEAEASRELTKYEKYHTNMITSYQESIKDSYQSLYWIDILEASQCYDRLPYTELRDKAENLQSMLISGKQTLDALLGNSPF